MPEEEAAKIVEAHEKNRRAEEEEEASAPAEAPAEEPAPAPVAEKQSLSAEEKQVHQLFADLRWLVTEGYVTEFGDGRLFANPPMNPSMIEGKASAPKEEAAADDTVKPAQEDASKDEAPTDSPAKEAASETPPPAEAVKPAPEISAPPTEVSAQSSAPSEEPETPPAAPETAKVEEPATAEASRPRKHRWGAKRLLPRQKKSRQNRTKSPRLELSFRMRRKEKPA